MTAPLPHRNFLTARPSVWISALLLVATVCIYWPVGHHEFVNFDDPDYVTENPHTQAGLTWGSVRWAFTESHSSNWHPLTWMSHMLDCQLFGLNPSGHHLMNLGFHTANVLLLFVLLRQLTGSSWRAGLVAGLFALHPLHVESVAWVAERKDVLSTCFGLLTLLSYAKHVRRVSPQVSITPVANSRIAFGKSPWYWAALGWFACGLMSKPMLVTWPCVLLLLDFWPLQRFSWPLRTMPAAKWQGILLEKIPFLLLTLASCLVTLIVQRGSGATVSLDFLPLSARLAQVSVAYVRYLGKTFWPDDLAAFYPYVKMSWDSAAVWGATVFLLLVTLVVLRQVRARPYLATGWFWFLGTLVPVIGLVQVGRQAIADRYTYIPHIGLFLALVWVGAEASQYARLPRSARALTACLLLLTCGLLTSRQLAHWKNTGVLAQQSIRATQGNYIAHAQLAGQLVLEGKLEEALAQCRIALQFRPDFAETHNTLGLIYSRQGKFEEALQSYQEATRCDPTQPQPHHGLAEIYLRRSQFMEAERESRAALQLAPSHLGAQFTLAQSLHSQNRFEEAIAAYKRLGEIKPGLFSVHRGLGSIYALRGDGAAALREFEAAARISPTNSDAHNSLGMLRLERGQVMEASNHFSLAAGFDPLNALANYQLGNLLAAARNDAEAKTHYQKSLLTQADQPELLNNFAWILDTSAKANVRDGPEAVRLAERACELTRHQLPQLIGTLAAAYAEAGRFEDARRAATNAIRIAESQGATELVVKNQTLLELYRRGQSFHQPP